MMKNNIHILRTVASILATVVLLGGFFSLDASAKTIKRPKASKTMSMNGPDFAYPKTVEKNAAATLEKAMAEGDWPSAIQAVIQSVTADNIVSRKNAVKGIARIDSVAALAPAEWRAPFFLIKADIYASIYGNIRWQADSRKLPLDSVPADPYEWSREIFADKVASLCNLLLDDSIDDTRSLKEWEKFLENTSDAFSFGMTAKEFIASRCFSLLGNFSDATHDVIPFFTTSSEPATPAQLCAALRVKAIDRLIESAEARGQSLLLAKSLSDKANILPNSQRMKFIVEAYGRVKDSEGEQLILSSMHDYMLEQPIDGMKSAFPYSKKEYLDMLHKSVAGFPKGRYVNSLNNIINDMTRPSADIWYDGQYLTSSNISMKAKLSNCDESWALVFDYAPYANSGENQPKTREVISRCRLVKAARLSAEGSVPFQADVEAKIGYLPKGTYVVIPSATADAKGVYSHKLNENWRQPFTVSDISVMTLSRPDATTSVFVVDGADGHPIKGAEVKVYVRKNYSSPRQLVRTLTTDADGSVTVSEERFDIEASYNGSKWCTPSRFYNSTARRDTTVRNKVQILPDRALLHPGDSVKAVLVAYGSREMELFLKEGFSFDVILRDANGKDVSSKSIATDSFGRAVVEFQVPEKGLLGTWQIFAYDSDRKWLGSASLQVADYVAPSFFITSEHSEEDVNPGDVVSLKGQVLTYSGMPVAGATVRYSVSYQPPMRWFFSGYATFDSSVTADADGKYVIDLPTSNLKGTQFERGIFSVQLSATSQAGESQNGPTERFAVGREYSIHSFDGGRKIEISDSIPSLTVYVMDMLGRRVKKEVSFEMTDKSTLQTVASGSFTSPVLQLPDLDFPSALYSLSFTLKEDPEVKFDMLLTLWRKSDKAAPAGTKLWVPCDPVTALPGEKTVDVTVGSGVADRWIPAVVSTDNRIVSVEWLHVEKDNLTLTLQAPQNKEKRYLNLSWLSELDSDMRNVLILPPSSEEKLLVKTESFRDKVSAGDSERWSFRFFRKSADASGIPAMAVMTDAALNAITPFNWNFNPLPNSNGNYFFMNRPFTNSGYISTALRKINYLPVSSISFPVVNDYGQDWGLNGGMYYDGGVAVYSGGIKNEMKLMRSAMAKQEVAAPMMNTMATADAGGAVFEDTVAVEEAEEASIEQSMVSGSGNPGDNASQDSPELRDTECPVAFFMPSLVSDGEGMVNVDFKVPNFNTTWSFQMMGYDSELQTAKVTLEAIASKPIMISNHAPRFVRTGDAIELTATVFNNSDAPCSPKCRFELVDLISGKIVSAKDFKPENIDLAGSRVLTMHWDVPSDVSAVGFRAYAETDSHRDGEQSLVPVLPASSPVVESTPFWIAPNGVGIEVKLPKFKSTDQVTLQYCDNPAWYCLSALPDIVVPESKSVTAKIKALYGNAIAYNLISSNSSLKKGLEILLSDKDSKFAALKSNLEKDGNLKITQLANTPWVNNAESETLRMSRLGTLLHDEDARKTISDIFNDIRSLQMSNGGWSWCPDMEASPYITRELLSHFAMILKAGAVNVLPESKDMIRKAIRYVDSETVKDYHKYHKKGESLSYLLDWLYVRSFFPTDWLSSGSRSAEMNTIAAKARKDIAAEWKDMGIGEKAKAAITLWRAGDRKVASEILESLRQFSSESPEKGVWFDNLRSGWGGMSVIRTTTLVLQGYAEIQPDNKIVDGLRQWLVLGRQYQDWGKNSYTVETVNAILTSGSDWTDCKAACTPEFSLKGSPIDVPETAKLTGAFTLTLDPKSASGKTLTVKRSGASPAWGGVISQYQAPIMEVKPAEVPELSIRKSVVALIEGKNGELVPKEDVELEKGMLVRVTLFINAGRDMDYVAVTDERSACLEPVDQLSGYRHSDSVGFYREVRDSQTNLFFGWLPKGQHVISYDCRVSQDGEFSCGIATAQSQYSPMTVAHSAGSTIIVK